MGGSAVSVFGFAPLMFATLLFHTSQIGLGTRSDVLVIVRVRSGWPFGVVCGALGLEPDCGVLRHVCCRRAGVRAENQVTKPVGNAAILSAHI